MRQTTFGFLILLLAGASVAEAQSRKKPRDYRMGISYFPFDLTVDAALKTREFVKEHADLIPIKQEDGWIPWAQALTDTDFPEPIVKKWAENRESVPEGYSVLLQLTPVKGDQAHLAPGFKENPLDPLASGIPPELAGKPFDHPDLIQAYTNYCRRAVQAIKPDFLVIAIEAHKVVQHRPKDWPAFMKLMATVRSRLKEEFPRLPIGASYSLQILWNNQVARAIKPTLKHADFLGLTFHPCMGIISELSNARALPRGRNQWLSPLKWARGFAGRVPIAICDTGYASRNNTVAALNLDLKGDPKSQQLYVSDLLSLAERDRYLFVVWGLGIDCDAIADKAPPGLSDFIHFLKNNGLVDQKFNAKPSLDVWVSQLRRNAPKK